MALGEKLLPMPLSFPGAKIDWFLSTIFLIISDARKVKAS